MQESNLTKLATELAASNIQQRSRQSTQWLLAKVAELRNPLSLAREIKNERDRAKGLFRVGGLYCFFYDPAGKSDLPYYDKFPLVLVLEKYPDGFLGINLHYLPVKMRAMFLDKLMKFAVMKEDDIIRMRISYEILNATRRYREFRPCIKKYLRSRLQSKILSIHPNEWEVATFLPMQQFKGAKPVQVWKESIQTIKDASRNY